jgi:hypothetical protein
MCLVLDQFLDQKGCSDFWTAYLIATVVAAVPSWIAVALAQGPQTIVNYRKMPCAHAEQCRILVKVVCATKGVQGAWFRGMQASEGS